MTKFPLNNTNMSLEKKYLAFGDLDTESIRRIKDAHKGTHGSLAIIGGQNGMLGALLLSARSALLSGAGRVYATPLATNSIAVDVTYPEIMFRSFDAIKEMANGLQVLVVGPGLGQSEGAIACLTFCLNQTAPLLIDADALNLIASNNHLANMLIARNSDTVITPHPGEAARLLNSPVSDIQEKRLDSALKLSQQYQCACVLKGSESICVDTAGEYWLNPTGNAGLATAGTGDVLSGIIGGFIAQGMQCFDALKLGVYLHGAAADNLVAKGIGPIGMTASEVALEARYLLNKWVS